MFLLLQCAWHCLTSLDSAHNLTCFIPADDKLYFTLEHTTVLHHNYKLCSTGKQLLNINKKIIKITVQSCILVGSFV